MINYLRFAGAQIPCTSNIELNILSLKKAIDWAAENQIDYLLTPEGSLSGYCLGFDTPALIDGLAEIEKYAKNKVALCLGTMWVENEDNADIKRNQIRFYSKEGILRSAIDKNIITPHDIQLGIVPASNYYNVHIPEVCINENILTIGGFICNDLYGKEGYQNLPATSFVNGANLFVHATNADRGVGRVYDQVMDAWHTASLQMVSYLGGIPIITVDNCCGMAGGEFDGPTSSQSGILIGGEWVVKAPRCGTHYFFYDFPLENLLNLDWASGQGKN